MKIPKNLGETAADIVTGSRIRRHLKLPNFRTAFRRPNASFFCLQAVLTLVTLLYFPRVLDLFFELRGETTQSFKIFLVFVPGLIFHAVFSAQEPVYEALNRPEELKQLTLITAGINLLLPVSEGGMNLKTTDINQLINTMGIKAMSEKKQLKRLFLSPERRSYVPA